MSLNRFGTARAVSVSKNSEDAMTTLANAIHKAKKLALETQATAYVIFDPSHLDNPPDLAYYAATEEEADTFYAGCEIVDTVEPEDIVS